MKHAIFNPRCRSLIRGNVLVLSSLAISLLLSDFPRNRQNPFLVIPAITAILGLADTTRCMQRRWNFYHGGVLLCIYMDLMSISMILFFLLYPYTAWITSK